MAVQTTQETIETMYGVTSPLRVTLLQGTCAYEVQSHLNVTQIVSAASYQIDSHLRCSGVVVQVLMPVSPVFDWIEMFIYEMFPDDISYDSVGSTRFLTDVMIVDSGFDQRNSRWDQPLMEYDVAYGVRTMEQLLHLIAFFRVMQGRKNAFLYKDWVDYTSSIPTTIEARKAPEIDFTDQLIGVGDNVTYQFQLTKTYETPLGNGTSVRAIFKPNADTVMMGVNGAEVENFAVDETTGIVTFTPRVTYAAITATLTLSFGQTWALVSAAGTYTGLEVGDGLLLSGFANALNNNTVNQVLSVIGISGDLSTVTFNGPLTGFGTNETKVGVNVASHPAPRSGQEVTAGYEFFVPVRFDTDTLSVTLEDYGVGGATNVKLIEVRPNAD